MKIPLQSNFIIVEFEDKILINGKFKIVLEGKYKIGGETSVTWKMIETGPEFQLPEVDSCDCWQFWLGAERLWPTLCQHLVSTF